MKMKDCLRQRTAAGVDVAQAGAGEGGGRGDRGGGLALSDRPVGSRSRSYRLLSGNGGNQDLRRTVQLAGRRQLAGGVEGPQVHFDFIRRAREDR